jgi:CGNR zinc finger
MNNTQIVLHEQDPEKNVINLGVAYYGVLFSREVHTYRRGKETYFRFAERDREATGQEHLSLRSVTESFLRIETCAQAQEFFERFGPLNLDESWVPKTAKWSELLHLQQLFETSWVTSYRDWPGDIKDLVFNFHLGFDAGNLEDIQLISVTDSVTRALVADLIFTTLSNSPSAFCVRPDCRKLFQKNTHHQRKYCSPECAHVESVRQFRARSNQRGKGKGR